MDDPFAPFLRAILQAPDDDLPRLIAADWLDERGKPERAEFIRVQVELARTPTFRQQRHANDCPRYGLYRTRHSPSVRGEGCQKCRLAVLRRRELALLKVHPPTWVPDVIHALDLYVQEDVIEGRLIRFCRGFVASITLTAADFIADAPAVFRCQPISSVALSDKWPEEYPPGRFGFTRGRQGCDAHDYIPAAICRFWPRSPGAAGWDYPSAEMARADLSIACVRYGRCAALEPKVFRALTRPPGRRTRA